MSAKIIGVEKIWVGEIPELPIADLAEIRAEGGHMDVLGQVAHLIKALALGSAASVAIFYFGMTQAKSDSDKELVAAMRVAIAVGVLVALGVWL
jgi:hypothetical protein